MIKIAAKRVYKIRSYIERHCFMPAPPNDGQLVEIRVLGEGYPDFFTIGSPTGDYFGKVSASLSSWQEIDSLTQGVNPDDCSSDH